MATPTKEKVTKGRPEPPAEPPLTTGFMTPTREATAATRATTTVQVAVYTGDIPGAGTDADIWLWVDGTLGRTQWLYLDNADDNFERNKTDYFYFTLADIGTPISAWVYFRRAGDKADWYLSTVTVNGRPFSHYKWISADGIYHLQPA